MNRDDIIRMARESGIVVTGEAVWKLCEIVAAAERQRMEIDSIHTCHAECQRPACVAVREAAKAEREACAKLFDGEVWSYDYREIAAAIRARGEK